MKLSAILGLNVSTAAIMAELDMHPDYPSLLAVSDVLTNFNIENAAFRVEFEELDQVPLPFLAHTRTNGGELVLVNKAGEGYYYLCNEKWDNHKVNAEAFKKMYNGVVLTAEAGAAAATQAPGLPAFIRQIKTPAMVTVALVTFAAALVYHTDYFGGLSWPLALLTLFKTAGVMVSVLLLVQSVDNNNPLVQALCQTEGKTNCNAILSSKAAKVFDGLSWSEVGFYYFAGTWLLLLFAGRSALVWQSIVLLNVLSLPYTLYSIYHQWRVARQWCVLCCTV